MPLRSLVTTDYDSVTKLPSMTYFRQYAGSYVKYAHRFGQRVLLVHFNLKNFSSFNERYGFEEGNNLLNLVADAIEEAFPGYFLSRFSADHFYLVCVSNHVERCILNVREQVHAYGRNANVELKAGIFVVDEDAPDIGLACDHAKSACDSIARRYDMVYRWFDDALSWRIERSRYIESHIDLAIKKGWIKVYYQPIVRSITGEVCEFEALARWDDPHYGFLSPAVFIEVLEQARLIHKLDSYVIRQACAEWMHYRGFKKWCIPISVNLSRLDFELMDVFEFVESITTEYDIPHQILHLEVTESALNESLELLSANVERFRNAGYQVWLDDFGSGYSSLNTLKDYKFDVVKIDMVFLREFETNPKSRVIISSVVNMAKQLGMQTLIEGVETREQFDYLREIGCEFMQGYLISKPVPAEVNAARLVSGELVVEDTALCGYYDRLGSINKLSATPFDFPWDDSANHGSSTELQPLAILERKLGECRFVYVGKAFVDVLDEIGSSDVDELAQRLADGLDGPSRSMREAVRAAAASGVKESVDVLENGRHCVFTARLIVSYDGVDALLVSLVNLTYITDLYENRMEQVAMRYLYAVYEQVNVIDLVHDVVNTVYRGNTMLPIMDAKMSIAEALESYCVRSVQKVDRERFRRFMDLTTIAERVSAAGRQYLAEAFRLKQANGLYEWITVLLVHIQTDDRDEILMCLRLTNMGVLSTVAGEERIPKSLLWDTLIELVPAGIFWKDADRRFAGVNKNFLDFYAFESVDDVLGKNDEDMGWHVSTGSFKNDEMRVLEGDSVLNAQGTCIARGGVRNIQASKIPLWKDGEVIGLLGYFTDETRQSDDSHKLSLKGFDRMADTDHLTGIPNLRGLTSFSVSYQEAYDEDGIDFACVILDIDGMSSLNGVYGRSFGNQVLKVVARTLTRTSGVSGSVARIGGDKFCALKQVVDSNEAQTVAAEFADSIQAIHEVSGIRMLLRCFVGCALFSECESLSEVLQLAEDRMRPLGGDRQA